MTKKKNEVPISKVEKDYVVNALMLMYHIIESKKGGLKMVREVQQIVDKERDILLNGIADLLYKMGYNKENEKEQKRRNKFLPQVKEHIDEDE